jgi:hypothetical protein
MKQVAKEWEEKHVFEQRNSKKACNESMCE